jgi:diaminopimelate epimerase
VKLSFVKGHGTGNDFVLIPDHGDQLDLTAPQVAAICNRSFGIGADGLIRVVQRAGLWFMDYRNADGSLAEICGNGTRVMARYLIANELVTESNFIIGTRGGDVQVKINSDDSISVVLGPVKNQFERISVSVNSVELVASLWTAPNPHVISIVDNLEDIGNLVQSPKHQPIEALPNGANFEFVQILNGREVAMRVYERGVGETLSCGSGACAAAKFMQQHWQTLDPITVMVPGGKLVIESLENNMVKLTGPAVLVAVGEIDLEALKIK